MSNSSLFPGRTTGREITSRNQTGFEEGEVARFLQAGNLQSRQNVRDLETPEERTLEESSVRETRRRGLFRGTRTKVSETATGFSGRFSDISAEELDQAVNVFQARTKEIRRRSGAPGREQLFKVGR